MVGKPNHATVVKVFLLPVYLPGRVVCTPCDRTLCEIQV